MGNDHHVFGWGVNLGAGLDLTKNDSLQLLGVYGEGVGGQGNDAGFVNSDAAFNANGNLEALPYWSAMIGFTHRWNEQFRSTLTYGYVNLDNASGQDATFYHTSSLRQREPGLAVAQTPEHRARRTLRHQGSPEWRRTAATTGACNWEWCIPFLIE